MGLLTRGLYLALWSMLLVGFAGGGFYLIASVPAVGGGGGGGAAVSRPAVGSSPVGPSGWAVLYLEAYLQAGQGTETSLAPFLAQLPQLANVKAGSFAVASAVAVDALEVGVGSGYWRITVAAQVLGGAPAAGGTSTSSTTAPPVALGTRYYVIGVQSRGGGYVAATVPMEIAAPLVPGAQATIFGSSQPVAPGDPVADTATHFLQALLAGQGEIGRYLAPGATVAPVTPAPFAQVTVTGLSEAKVGAAARGAPRLMVLVGAEATDSAGRTQELAYTLDMSRLLGRWDVTRLVGAPPLAANTLSRPPSG